MPDLEFQDPWLLLASLAAPLVYVLAERSVGLVTYSTLELVGQAHRSSRARLARLPAVLLAVAALAFAIALAGPRTGDATTVIRREGIAIVMVVDRSGSMRARDFVLDDANVSRLEVVKRVFRRFVEEPGGRREGDLIGLVAFARYADGLCPLTLDHGNLLSILDDLAIVEDPDEDGTAIGEGLALGVERLRRITAPSKVAILLTDGVNNAGEVDPLQAADLAAQYGVKVYAIGAGTTGTAPVPVRTRSGAVVLRRAFVEIDEATLQRIAERTGGRYFHARDAKGLEQVIEEIGALERAELTEVRYLQYRYHYAGFVGAGLGAIAASALLAGTWLRRLP